MHKINTYSLSSYIEMISQKLLAHIATGGIGYGDIDVLTSEPLVLIPVNPGTLTRKSGSMKHGHD